MASISLGDIHWGQLLNNCARSLPTCIYLHLSPEPFLSLDVVRGESLNSEPNSDDVGRGLEYTFPAKNLRDLKEIKLHISTFLKKENSQERYK